MVSVQVLFHLTTWKKAKIQMLDLKFRGLDSSKVQLTVLEYGYIKYVS